MKLVTQRNWNEWSCKNDSYHFTTEYQSTAEQLRDSAGITWTKLRFVKRLLFNPRISEMSHRVIWLREFVNLLTRGEWPQIYLQLHFLSPSALCVCAIFLLISLSSFDQLAINVSKTTNRSWKNDKHLQLTNFAIFIAFLRLDKVWNFIKPQ